MASVRVSIEKNDKHRQALELRKAGASYEVIADKLGYSHPSGAHKAVTSALQKTLREPADDLRNLELDRLDAIMLALWQPARQGNQGAVDRILRIMERRSKLLGLDAPAKQHNLNVDLSNLTDEQLQRIAAGEDPASVLAATTQSGG